MTRKTMTVNSMIRKNNDNLCDYAKTMTICPITRKNNDSLSDEDKKKLKLMTIAKKNDDVTISMVNCLDTAFEK